MMPKLNYKEVKYQEIFVGDLEMFIEDVYGQEFSFSDDVDGANQDVLYPYTLNKYSTPDSVAVEEFRKTGDHHNLLPDLLADCHDKGLIEKGKYLLYY